ncbi:MAG: hypothetical protein AAGJ18_29685, partial [Bacteroidota bacterium]
NLQPVFDVAPPMEITPSLDHLTFKMNADDFGVAYLADNELRNLVKMMTAKSKVHLYLPDEVTKEKGIKRHAHFVVEGLAVKKKAQPKVKKQPIQNDKDLLQTAIAGMRTSLEFLDGTEKQLVETAIAGMEAALEFV